MLVWRLWIHVGACGGEVPMLWIIVRRGAIFPYFWRGAVAGFAKFGFNAIGISDCPDVISDGTKWNPPLGFGRSCQL